jgi:hypothetical protein
MEGSETDISGEAGRKFQAVGLVAYKEVSDHDEKVSVMSMEDRKWVLIL